MKTSSDLPLEKIATYKRIRVQTPDGIGHTLHIDFDGTIGVLIMTDNITNQHRRELAEKNSRKSVVWYYEKDEISLI